MVKIPLDAKHHTYGQILPEADVAVFDSRSVHDLSPMEVVSSPVLFRVAVDNHAITRGRYARAYKAIVRGDPEVRVVRLFGRPFRMIGRPDFIAWDELARTNGGECVREFWYVPTIDLCGEEWRIGFDDRSNVVSKFHIVSP